MRRQAAGLKFNYFFNQTRKPANPAKAQPNKPIVLVVSGTAFVGTAKVLVLKTVSKPIATIMYFASFIWF
jgi:hypothetical protein